MGTREVHIDPDNPFLTYSRKCNLDRIVVQGVLEFVPVGETVVALNNWRRYLKLGGEFVLIFPDFIRAAFLYKRNTLSYEALVEIVNHENLLDRERIENMLTIRYSEVNEVSYLEGVSKKVFETILIAKK